MGKSGFFSNPFDVDVVFVKKIDGSLVFCYLISETFQIIAKIQFSGNLKSVVNIHHQNSSPKAAPASEPASPGHSAHPSAKQRAVRQSLPNSPSRSRKV